MSFASTGLTRVRTSSRPVTPASYEQHLSKIDTFARPDLGFD